MATKTNYSWTTPDDTDLVKDGAAAIRTLGSSIDTTVFTNAGAAVAKSIVDAKGDLIAATAADTVDRLAVGANDTVLTADSTTSTGLKWAVAAAGGMTLLSTITASAASSVSFTSIPATHKHLLLITGDARNPSGTDNSCFVRFNADSGTNYHTIGTTNNNNSFNGYNERSATSIGASSSPFGFLPLNGGANFAQAQNQIAASMWVYDYQAITPVNYSYQSQSHYENGPNAFYYTTATGRYSGGSAINEITITPRSTNTISGVFKLYGVS